MFDKYALSLVYIANLQALPLVLHQSSKVHRMFRKAHPALCVATAGLEFGVGHCNCLVLCLTRKYPWRATTLRDSLQKKIGHSIYINVKHVHNCVVH